MFYLNSKELKGHVVVLWFVSDLKKYDVSVNTVQLRVALRNHFK